MKVVDNACDESLLPSASTGQAPGSSNFAHQRPKHPVAGELRPFDASQRRSGIRMCRNNKSQPGASAGWLFSVSASL